MMQKKKVKYNLNNQSNHYKILVLNLVFMYKIKANGCILLFEPV